MRRVEMRKKFISMGIVGALLVQPAIVSNAKVIPTDVSKASQGCVIVGIKGDFVTEQKKAVKRINEIRKEACTKHYINPQTGKKLQASDYVAIEWSTEMERQARIRAAEAGMAISHTRPNGKDCFSVVGKEGVFICGEVLAWNYSKGMLRAIEQWYGEKQDWVKQNSSAVTGHYTAMINPANIYVGLGTFVSQNAIWLNSTCGRFSNSSKLDTTAKSAQKACTQKVEVVKSAISNNRVNLPTTMKKGQTKKLSVIASCTIDRKKSTVVRLESVTFKTSSKAVKVTSDGTMKALKKGSYKVKVTYTGKIKGATTKTVKIK